MTVSPRASWLRTPALRCSRDGIATRHPVGRDRRSRLDGHQRGTGRGSADHVATVLYALDGRDDEGIRAMRKKPLLTRSRRSRRNKPSRFAVASSRPRRLLGAQRRRQHGYGAGPTPASVRPGFGGRWIAAVVGGRSRCGWFALNHLPALPGSAAAPTPSASPSDNLIAVTWDPEPDYNAAMADFHYPECGEEFDPKPQAVGGVTPKPQLQHEEGGPGDDDFNFVRRLLSPMTAPTRHS